MKQDIWIAHAEKVRAARDKKQAAINLKREWEKTTCKCDNCGVFGAERVWFRLNDSDDMAGFDKNLCDECRKKFDKWQFGRNYKDYLG